MCRRSEAPRAPQRGAARAAHGHAPLASPAGGKRRTSAGQAAAGSRQRLSRAKRNKPEASAAPYAPPAAHAAAACRRALPLRAWQRQAQTRRRGRSHTSKTALAATQSSLEGGVAAARTPPAASASASSAASSAARAMARDWRCALTQQAPGGADSAEEGLPAVAARRKPSDATRDVARAEHSRPLLAGCWRAQRASCSAVRRPALLRAGRAVAPRPPDQAAGCRLRASCCKGCPRAASGRAGPGGRACGKAAAWRLRRKSRCGRRRCPPGSTRCAGTRRSQTQSASPRCA